MAELKDLHNRVNMSHESVQKMKISIQNTHISETQDEEDAYQNDLGLILVKLDNCKQALEAVKTKKAKLEKEISEKTRDVTEEEKNLKKVEEKVGKSREKLNRVNEDRTQLVELQEIYQQKLVSV